MDIYISVVTMAIAAITMYYFMHACLFICSKIGHLVTENIAVGLLHRPATNAVR